MSTDTTSNTTESTGTTGIAALQQEIDPFSSSGPYPVTGIVMPENVVTRGSSGQKRKWPASALRDAADTLEGKSIVTDFHEPTAQQAPASAIIGQITDVGYEPGVGIRFNGELSDQDIAKKVSRNYLEVSARPMIAEEHFDESESLRVVDEISNWLDLAVVDMGAASGNQISMGNSAKVAALMQSWGAQTPDETGTNRVVESLALAEARTPSYDGFAPASDRSWPDGGPNLGDYIDAYYEQSDSNPDSDDQPSDWSDLPQDGRNWISARSFLGDPDADSSEEGISFPVVFPDGPLSEDGLQSARSMRGQGTTEQQASSIEQRTRSMLNEHFDAGIDEPESNHLRLGEDFPVEAAAALTDLDDDMPVRWTGGNGLERYGRIRDTIGPGQLYDGALEDGAEPIQGPAALIEVYTYSSGSWSGTGRMVGSKPGPLTTMSSFPPQPRQSAATRTGGNQTQSGEAMSQHNSMTSLSQFESNLDALQDGEDESGSEENESGGGGSNSDGGDDSGNNDSRLDTWATFIATMSSADLSEVNLNALYRLIAAEIEGSNPADVGDALPADAFESSLSADDIKERIGGLLSTDDGSDSDDEDGEDEDSEDTEANVFQINDEDTGLTAALKQEAALTGSTPDRCLSIKDGSQPVGSLHKSIASDVLPREETAEEIDISEDGDSVSRQALGLKTETDNTEREPEIVDIESDPISRSALGLPTGEERGESESKGSQEDIATKAYGERVRAAAEGEDIQQTDAKTSLSVGEDPITQFLLGLREQEPDEDTQAPLVRQFGDRVREQIEEATDPDNRDDRHDPDEDALASSAVSGDRPNLSVTLEGGDEYSDS